MKKNVLKKFAAAALAAATVMSSMSVMAFADEAGESAETKGSVTITKYMSTSGTGDTLSTENYTGAAPTGEEYKLLKNVEFAYVKVGERVQVDTATSDSSQTEIQYTVTDENFLDAIGIKKAEVNKNFTQKTLNEKVSSSANKTKVINFVNTYKGANKTSTDENGTASFTELDLNALYVFAETDATNAALASDGSKVNVTKVSVPEAEIFTKLESVKEGDIFLIHVLNETLAYKVDQIKVVEPSETDDLKIVPGYDYATLVTCTPYGINSHRLLVRGIRTEYTQDVSDEAAGQAEEGPDGGGWKAMYEKAIIEGILFAVILVVLINVIVRKSGKKNKSEAAIYDKKDKKEKKSCKKAGKRRRRKSKRTEHGW